MSTLYRLYRPLHFDDVIGQAHIKGALQNALTKDKVSHAYVFSGPRGSGKTTFARLFAKSVNCLKPKPDGNPCNSCEVCLDILNNSAVDVIEIDAASNRGIDEIRELRERVNFTPVKTKYKVYIIDEVHMLTPPAFNALLKTLEEPPAHVIFILATTEQHKVPETILSRCQRFHFHRASNEQLRGLLEKVAKNEKIQLDSAAYDVIVARSEGSFRDGLSLLGSLAGQTKKISAGELQEMLGLPPQQIIDQLTTSLEAGQPLVVQKILVDCLQQGWDLVVMAKVLADVYKRQILLAESESNLGKDAQILEQLLVAISRSRYSSDPAGSIISRLISIASALQKTAPVQIAPKAAEPIPTNVENIQSSEKVEEPAKSAEEETAVDPITREKSAVIVLPDNISSPLKPVEGAEEFWNALLHEIKQQNHALYMLLKSAVLLDLTDSKMLLAVKFRFYSERLFEAKNRKVLEGAAEKIAGKKLALECEVRSDLDTKGGNEEDLVSAVVDVFELEESE
ncbi:MAG: DNA polymerase III subunit gamma/tau [Patescibacteria group bacterium]